MGWRRWRRPRGGAHLQPPRRPPAAVCLENEKAFEAVKDLVVKEYNHAKPEGKLTWKADKVGAYHFTDPDKCGQGLSLTVNVVDAAAPKGARKLMVAA